MKVKTKLRRLLDEMTSGGHTLYNEMDSGGFGLLVGQGWSTRRVLRHGMSTFCIFMLYSVTGGVVEQDHSRV